MSSDFNYNVGFVVDEIAVLGHTKKFDVLTPVSINCQTIISVFVIPSLYFDSPYGLAKIRHSS